MVPVSLRNGYEDDDDSSITNNELLKLVMVGDLRSEAILLANDAENKILFETPIILVRITPSY
jgi:hypothetical protein